VRVDRFAANKIDAKNLEKLKLLNEGHKPWEYGADPGSRMILNWNRVYLVACLFALFVDPFFYYLPFVRQQGQTSCIAKDRRLISTITALRSLADLFYLLNIVVKFHTAYVDPKSRVLGKGELIVDLKKIQRRYIRTYFLVDLLAAVPLPQVNAAREHGCCTLCCIIVAIAYLCFCCYHFWYFC
jgi:cyclic nucleotide gated channel